jgi:hypothetical protein
MIFSTVGCYRVFLPQTYQGIKREPAENQVETAKMPRDATGQDGYYG